MGIFLTILFVCVSVTVVAAMIGGALFMGVTALMKRAIDRIRWMIGMDNKKGGDE